jgi:hypothetical protein
MEMKASPTAEKEQKSGVMTRRTTHILLLGAGVFFGFVLLLVAGAFFYLRTDHAHRKPPT